MLLVLVRKTSIRKGRGEKKRIGEDSFIKINYMLRGLLPTLSTIEHFLVEEVKRDPHEVRQHLLCVGKRILSELDKHLTKGKLNANQRIGSTPRNGCLPGDYAGNKKGDNGSI